LAEDSAPSFASVELRHRIGALQLDVTFTLTQPWTILFGPSGSGKTTVLRAIAGLIRPNRARIVFGPPGRQTIAVDTQNASFIPAHLRCTRVAAQQTALFPHMTVRENIAFGALSANHASPPAPLVDQAIQQFRLGSLAPMLPAKLSGGERQRVAIARAAASAISLADRAILLLDEPFTGMDAKLRDQLIADLQQSLAPLRIPVLSVTHDVAEAFQLDAEVVKLAEGRVVAQGPVASVLAAERARLLEQLSPAE
jgi:molybdate transport system ATP-binding protein